MEKESAPKAYGRCQECDCPYYKPENDYERTPCVNKRSDGTACTHRFDQHSWTE